jgi:prepilin-type N-terminal cleavage/methylation domain-containing protein
MRRGFTLIEAMMVIVIFAFGMLAVVETSAETARDLGIARRRSHALKVARNRVGELHAVACRQPDAGTSLGAGGFREIWRVDVDGARRIVSDSVVFAVAGGRVTNLVVRAEALCE